jgi:hypothetical protein
MGEDLNYRQSLCKLGKEEIDLGNLLATEKDTRNGAHQIDKRSEGGAACGYKFLSRTIT